MADSIERPAGKQCRYCGNRFDKGLTVEFGEKRVNEEQAVPLVSMFCCPGCMIELFDRVMCHPRPFLMVHHPDEGIRRLQNANNQRPHNDGQERQAAP